MTDEPQSQSSDAGEPVTEERPAVSVEQPTAQHQPVSSEPVTLPTQISEPAPASPAPAAPVAASPLSPAPPTPPTPAATRPPLPPPVPPAVEIGPQPGPSPIDKVTTLVAERPEVGVGGAFAGGIVFALILKRLGR